MALTLHNYGWGSSSGFDSETPEQREKRLMTYELEKRENERIGHQHKMEHDRQEQDYNLAMRARLVVGWIVGACGVTFLVCATIVVCKMVR